MRLRPFILFVALVSSLLCGPAWGQTFSSSGTQTNLIEVYASQGCSSCPPAQDWVNTLGRYPGLWKDVIPVVFHVDYWDYLGWKDPFSSKDYTRRQHYYHKMGNVSSVYTPGFVLNGKEWRGWFKKWPLPKNRTPAGTLSAEVRNGRLTASYDGGKGNVLNVAVLGFGLATKVTAGENRNRELREEFTVIGFQTKPSNNGRWQMALPQLSQIPIKQTALAVWVTQGENPTPLQATGGWLSQK